MDRLGNQYRAAQHGKEHQGRSDLTSRGTIPVRQPSQRHIWLNEHDHYLSEPQLQLPNPSDSQTYSLAPSSLPQTED